MEETIKFMHQCLNSPTVDTLCKALDNDQLIGFPHMTSKLVRKFLPESTATAKGHMNRNQKGLCSTTKTNKPQNPVTTEEDFRPKIEEEAEVEIFVGATIADANDGTIYTDQTGHFPIMSYSGMKYQFVAYEYRSNAILIRPLRDQTDASLKETFESVYEYLASKGFKPKLNVMDNQCSKAIEQYIKSTGADIQLVNPDDHRVNACERAIQTWKNHWIAGLATHLNCNQYRSGIQYPFFMYLIHFSYIFFGIQYCEPPKVDTSCQSHDVSFLHQSHFFLTHTTIISRSLFYACIFSHCISLNSLAIDSKSTRIQLQSH
jgi:hypothetical protein